MALIKELKNRKRITSKLNSKDIDSTLAKMYQWVIDQDRLEKYIHQLIDIFDDLRIPTHTYYHSPGIASLEEQAAVGFTLMGCCYGYSEGTTKHLRDGIMGCVDKYNLIDFRNSWQKNHIPNIRSKYLVPFWDYLIEKVERENKNYTIESKIEFKMASVFQEDFKKNYPETFQQIETTNQSLNHTENTWEGVANSCRTILSEFGKELLQNYPIKDDIKEADAKGIIRSVLKKDLPKNKHNRTLIALFESSWNHVSSALHRSNLDKDEAIRIFTWIILTISEIADIKK